ILNDEPDSALATSVAQLETHAWPRRDLSPSTSTTDPQDQSQSPTMTADWIHSIANALVTARMTGAPAALTPEVLARLDDEAGSLVQHLTLERLWARIVGWKVAVMPDGHVIAAPIIDRLLLHSPATLPTIVY